MFEDVRARAEKIRLVLLDVDGVLTDGRLYYGPEGEALKAFHVRDGLGVRLLQENGVEVGIITARKSAPLERRVSDLRIRHFFPGQDDKLACYEALKKKLSLDDNEIAYVGDDLIDLPILHKVGLAVTVADGHPMVKGAVHYATEAPGGNGAVRELADLILECRFGLAAVKDRFLEKKPKREEN